MRPKEPRRALRSKSPAPRNSHSPDRREERVEARRRESLGYRLDLEDPPPQPSRNATLSITKPVIRIEREDGRYSDNGAQAIYRITSAFVLQISINDFNDGTQRFNKFFNSVSLRYLYDRGENHSFWPAADRMTSATVVTSIATEKGMTAGVSGDSIAAIAPSLELQFVANDSVEVERQSKSWRKGVSIEDYRHSQPGNSQCAPGLHDFLLIRSRSPPPRCVRFSRIHPPHHGRGHHAVYHCDPSLWSHDCAVHWHWQRDADVNAWTPEIYQSTLFPITVTRKVPVTVVQKALARGDTHQIQEWLHFDFKLEVQLRELGHRFKDLLSPSEKPPDMKLKRDYGELLRPEYWAFCTNCLPQHVEGNWPDLPTRDRRERYLEVSRKKGFLYSRLPDLDDESSDEDKNTEKKEVRPEPTDTGCCHSCCIQGSCALHLPVIPCCSYHNPYQPWYCNHTPRETVTVECIEKGCSGDNHSPHGSHNRMSRHVMSRITDLSRSPSPSRRMYRRPESLAYRTRSRPRSVHVITRRGRQERSCSPPRHVWFDRDTEEHPGRAKYCPSRSMCTLSDGMRDLDCNRRDLHEGRDGIIRPYRVRIASPSLFRGRSVSPRRSSPRLDGYY